VQPEQFTRAAITVETRPAAGQLGLAAAEDEPVLHAAHACRRLSSLSHHACVVFDERELKHLIETWGADHIMLDYPFDMAEPDPVGFLGRVKGVSEKDMALVAGGNAERLLGLPAKAASKK
jgi:hypothetical protein